MTDIEKCRQAKVAINEYLEENPDEARGMIALGIAKAPENESGFQILILDDTSEELPTPYADGIIEALSKAGLAEVSVLYKLIDTPKAL